MRVCLFFCVALFYFFYGFTQSTITITMTTQKSFFDVVSYTF